MENKKYHFVRVKEVRGDGKSCWYFKPETKEDLDEHWSKYVVNEINDGTKEYVEHLKAHAENRYIGHYTTMWGSMIEMMTAACQVSPNALKLIKIENDMYNQRLRDIENGTEIYLSEGLTCFMLTEGYTEIVEHYYSDTLSFPTHKYTIADVRFIKWNGGEHWYAKLGTVDIVDDMGNQKWNTREEAEKAAEEYIKNI